MPRLCEFYGIVISMYFSDHTPPHFHAIYGEHEALVAGDSLEILRGRLPRRAESLVLEWSRLHQVELRDDWQRARRHEPLVAIPPLD